MTLETVPKGNACFPSNVAHGCWRFSFYGSKKHLLIQEKDDFAIKSITCFQNDVKLFHETIMIFHRQINGKSSGIYCAYSQAVRQVDAYQGRIARKTSIKFKKHLTYIEDCGIVESDDHETFHEIKESQ